MDILCCEKGFVVCEKPVGADSEHDVPAALREAVGGDIFPVHRLDKNVGGVMVYARTGAAAAELSRAIQSGAFVKEYVARVHGETDETGVLEDLLWKDSQKNKVFVVRRERRGVKAAKLSFTRLCTDGETSLVRVRLFTGRSHQIRVQFASRKHPLVGDRKYGGRDDAPAPLLFSCCVTFPFGGKEYRFERLPQWAKEAQT